MSIPSNLDNWENIKNEIREISRAKRFPNPNQTVVALKKLEIAIQAIESVGVEIPQEEFDFQVGRLSDLLDRFSFLPKQNGATNLQVPVSAEHNKIWQSILRDSRYPNDPQKQEKAFSKSCEYTK